MWTYPVIQHQGKEKFHWHPDDKIKSHRKGKTEQKKTGLPQTSSQQF